MPEVGVDTAPSELLVNSNDPAAGAGRGGGDNRGTSDTVPSMWRLDFIRIAPSCLVNSMELCRPLPGQNTSCVRCCRGSKGEGKGVSQSLTITISQQPVWTWVSLTSGEAVQVLLLFAYCTPKHKRRLQRSVRTPVHHRSHYCCHQPTGAPRQMQRCARHVVGLVHALPHWAGSSGTDLGPSSPSPAQTPHKWPRSLQQDTSHPTQSQFPHWTEAMLGT